MEVDINEHFKVPGDFSRVKTYHINLYDAMPEKYQEQEKNIVCALDIGTRSIVGAVGRAEEGRFHVLAIEKEEHGKRAMRLETSKPKRPTTV